MDLLNSKIKASTLFEVIVASIIIVATLFIGLMIFSNIYHALFQQSRDQQAIRHTQSIFNPKLIKGIYQEEYQGYTILIQEFNQTYTQDFFIILTHNHDTIWQTKRTFLKNETP